MSSSRDAAVLARQDALMILDRAPREKLADALVRLAGRSDDVGALIASPWLDDYLLARGEDRLSEPIKTQLLHTATQAAKTGADPDRARAAQALDHVAQLSGVPSGIAASWKNLHEQARGFASGREQRIVDLQDRVAEARGKAEAMADAQARAELDFDDDAA
jgi:hypothetical protein